MTLIAESESPAATSLAPMLRQLVQEIDRDMAVFDARRMQAIYINRAVKTPTVIAEIVSTLGVMGLMLAVVGLYGLAAYSVGRRTCEIGIRMALGVDPLSVTKMVLKQGLAMVDSFWASRNCRYDRERSCSLNNWLHKSIRNQSQQIQFRRFQESMAHVTVDPQTYLASP